MSEKGTVSDMVGTNGVIAVGFGEGATWQLERARGDLHWTGYRYIVRCIETQNLLGFADIEEAALAFREVIA